MPGPGTDPAAQPLSRLTLAHIACLCLGVACICWGLAPAIVERVVTGQFPRPVTFASGSVTIVVGLLFLALHVYVRRGRRWAMWLTLAVSVAIFGFSAPNVVAGGGISGSFLPIFAVCAAITNWLGLKVDDLQRAEEEASWKREPRLSHLRPARRSPIFSRAAVDGGGAVEPAPRPMPQPKPAAKDVAAVGAGDAQVR